MALQVPPPVCGVSASKGRGGRARGASILIPILMLAACGSEPDPGPSDEERAAQAERDRQAALAYFEDTFAGRWGDVTDCSGSGNFELTAERFDLAGLNCEITSMTREGDEIHAEGLCAEEGRELRVPRRDFELIDEGGNLITVNDQTASWLRYSCGA